MSARPGASPAVAPEERVDGSCGSLGFVGPAGLARLDFVGLCWILLDFVGLCWIIGFVVYSVYYWNIILVDQLWVVCPKGFD